jgi:hypothetical protein
MKGWGLVLLLGVSILAGSGPAGGWVSGTGEIDISRSVVQRMADYECHSSMAGDGSLRIGGSSPGASSLSYSGDVPLVGFKRIETGSPFRGTKSSFQEAFSATDMEREVTTSASSHLVATDMKLAFNGTYVTSSNMHQAFVRDVSSHQRYTGNFEIQNMIQFGSLANRRPALSVTVLPQDCSAQVGGPIRREYAVSNVGTVPVRDLSLVDSRVGPVPLSRTELSPGEVASGSSSFALGEEDVPGLHKDSIVATAVDYAGNGAEASASATVDLIGWEGLNLTVESSDGCIHPGGGLASVYTIENTGDLPINNLTVTDSIAPGPVAANLTLMPGEAVNLTADLAVLGPSPLTRLVSASGNRSDGEMVARSIEVVLQPC